ncbi:PREDICTED: sodium channel protein 60E-like [Priapulus caudatus]|uniref:Sodium channel protein 60E-like n=1 Tax=Priapulus caudatus TaxID=37621 RepID=A0ABM1EBM8_PRICU|nr:PREDICTED: sodium channel protein 60E-like [Priapulus caudatus]
MSRVDVDIDSHEILTVFEDIYLDEKPALKRVLFQLNIAFLVLFTIEMFMKWIAYGLHRYFTNFWTILDARIVTVSVISAIIESKESHQSDSNIVALRSLRTLRALRPLRAISRWEGMKIVVNALMFAIPSICNVLLVCLVFWLIFSIMGVQFFGGKFFKCLDADGNLFPVSKVDTLQDCLRGNHSWVNSNVNFDNVINGYLALLQVRLFVGSLQEYWYMTIGGVSYLLLEQE